jgi:hypothetical protein
MRVRDAEIKTEKIKHEDAASRERYASQNPKLSRSELTKPPAGTGPAKAEYSGIIISLSLLADRISSLQTK